MPIKRLIALIKNIRMSLTKLLCDDSTKAMMVDIINRIIHTKTDVGIWLSNS